MPDSFMSSINRVADKIASQVLLTKYIMNSVIYFQEFDVLKACLVYR